MSMPLTPGSRYGVVLDACVLVGFPLCDTLLRLAERRFFRPYWTTAILNEVEHTLMEKLNLSESSARKRIGQMAAAFPEAMVSNVPEMRLELPDSSDEHVLAATIASEAQAIVTLNLRHFPVELCSRHDVEVIHPDDFLVHQFDLDPRGVRNVIYAQIGATRSPAYGVADLLRKFQPHVPTFEERMRNEIARDVQGLTQSRPQTTRSQRDQ